MSNPMMTFSEQLEVFPPLKEYLLTPPRLYKDVIRKNKPWRVYARQFPTSRWLKRDFWTYIEAFKFFKERRQDFHDMSISCRCQGFKPPGKIVRLKRNGVPLMVTTPKGKVQATKLIPIQPPAYHLWCMYCRRFTVFGYYFKHHAFNEETQWMMDPSKARCSLCGISEETGAFRRS